MDITHNAINNAILDMEVIVAKGQPFAKANKDRRIRAVLREMRKQQHIPPALKDLWIYLKMWLVAKSKNIYRKF